MNSPLMQAIEAHIEADRATSSPEANLFRQVSETLDAASTATAAEPWAVEAEIEEHGPRFQETVRPDTQILFVMVRKLAEGIFWTMEPYWTLVQNDDRNASTLFTLK